jgi:hypothetical protein
MAEVHVAKEGISLAHPLENRHGGNPESDSECDPPKRRQTESQTGRDHRGHKHHFAITAEE